jgi:hypothetical protein
VRGLKPDLESAFRTATKAQVGALITITNANLFLQQKQLADLAMKYKLPTMIQSSTWVESGGLMSYSTDELGAFRRAAYSGGTTNEVRVCNQREDCQADRSEHSSVRAVPGRQSWSSISIQLRLD